jgi:cation transport ATPase
VLSGALNCETVLTISVSNLASDFRYAKIMRVMQDAEANRSQMRRVADRLVPGTLCLHWQWPEWDGP